MGGRRLLAATPVIGLVLALSAAAEPLRPDEVPEPLRPWVGWALRGHEAELCPFLHGAPHALRQQEPRPCAWPGVLELDLADQRGRFAQRWIVYAETMVPLPGDEARFPESLQVDGRPAAVILQGDRPVVRLGPGSHALAGELRYPALPEALATPPETGLVALRLRGTPVALPVRDLDGRLWLRSAAPAAGEEAARLEVDVHRLVTDEIPLELRTRIELRVAGRGREALLGRALPDGFVPVALEGALPARLEPDGRLRVQVRPGTWTLELFARRSTPELLLVLPDPDGPWDEQEIVAFEARPALREVEPSGPPPVDPQQTLLPEPWRAFPAFLMEPGSALELVEKRRGDAEPAADRLELERTLWLDFDGAGYTVSDRMTGSIARGWRLEMGPGIQLGRAALSGTDQFVTRLPGAENVGMEVAQGPLELEADSRIEKRGGALPAVGWDADLHGLRGQLHLPPGWRLLHASGVDRAATTWLSRWTLLDLFVVLLVSIALLRLAGPAVAAVALAALGLSYTEPGAPRFVWVAVMVGEALRRVLPSGRLGRAVRAYRAVALGVLVLISLAFALQQVRGALFPSLEDTGFAVDRALATSPREAALQARAQMEGAEVDMAEAESPMRALGYVVEEGAQKQRAAGSRADSGLARERSDLYAPDPSARITTGPGLPRWEWRRVELTWNGPVERSQELRLWLLPPGATRSLAIVRVALLAVLLLFLLGPLSVEASPPPRDASGGWLAGVAILCLFVPAVARAQHPEPDMLEELRRRLLESPACAPVCASAPLLRIDAAPERLEIVLRIDAAARTAVPLPVPLRAWSPERVLLDRQPAAGVRREGALLWLALEPGVHEVLLSGPLPPRDAIEIPLPLRPQRVEVAASGWRVTGLLDEGVAGDSLRLERVGTAMPQEGPGGVAASALPPFARVVRQVSLGLSWQATTSVERVSAPDTALLLEIPLLPGESVTSPHVRAEADRAFVSLAPGTSGTRFESILEVRPELAVQAGDQAVFAETWIVEASPVWHVEAEGIPPVHDPAPEGRRVRQWRPWPGERVDLAVTRPEGVAGPTVTIDASELEVTPGLRAADASLVLHLRSSQGGQHKVLLPEGAQLEGAAIDGVEQPLRQQEREVTIPLVPGSRSVELRFREPRGETLLFRTPAIDLGAPSANAELRVVPPGGRWTLWAGGPRLGPAVLFWPFLVLLAAIAWGLSRIDWTPLRAHHWLLLGVGLTQVPVAAAAIVAAWLLALGWRGRHGTRVPGRWFDLLQLAVIGLSGLALATLFWSIEKGLLGLPEMQIAGNDSSARLLRWYQDRAEPAPEGAFVLSVPLLVYRGAMLAWALWLAQAVVGWLRWGWQCFTAGETWRPLRRSKL